MSKVLVTKLLRIPAKSDRNQSKLSVFDDGVCGAVLISADLALSAAHCFWDFDTGKVNM